MRWYVISALWLYGFCASVSGEVTAGKSGELEVKQSQNEISERVVSFSEPSRVFVDRMTVELRGARKGEQIRYTIDGSVPDADSSLYKTPLSFETSTQLRAMLFDGAKALGVVSMASYLALDKDLAGFSSNLPIVILENWAKGRPGQKSYQDAFMGIVEPGDQMGSRAEIVSPFSITSRCGIKRRGSSTADYSKYSLTVEGRDEALNDEAFSVCGLPADSDWVLGASYEIDRSLIRDDLIYRLSRDIGEYAPRTQLVEVFLNVGGGRLSYRDSYFGVLSLTEKIKRGKHRVRIARTATGESESKDFTGGYLFKHDRPDPGDVGFDVFGLGKFYWVMPKEREVESAHTRYLSDYLADFSLALSAPQGKHPISKQHFSEFIDERSWLVWHWLNTLVKNLDAYNASAYFYKNQKSRNGGRIGAGPLWDFDRSMNSNDPRDDSPVGWGTPGDSGRSFGDHRSPWWGLMFSDPEFRQKHIDLWGELRNGPLSWEAIEAVIDELSSELQFQDAPSFNPGLARSPVERNFKRWPAMPPRGGEHTGEIQILKKWLQARLYWIDRQFTQAPKFSHSSARVEKGTKVHIQSSKGVKIYWTYDGSDPRLPGGKVNKNALSESTFEVSSSRVVIARARKGTGLTSWSSPVRKVYLIGDAIDTSILRLADMQANPRRAQSEKEKAVSAKAADFEYLELKNSSSNKTVDLTGSTFTDGIKFSFDQAAITVLKPQESLYLVRHPEGFRIRHGEEKGRSIAGSYAPSNLDNKGEKLRLINGIGEVLFEEEFSPAASGQ